MSLFYRNGSPVKAEDHPHVVMGARGDSGYITESGPCSRCGGAGGSNAWKHTGWTCYRCGGRGTEPRTRRVFTADKLARLNALAEKRAARKQAERDRKAKEQRREFIDWAKPHGKLIGGILMAKGNSFLADIAAKLRRQWTLSPAQLEAARRVMDQAAKRTATDAMSQHVGEPKQRIEFEAVVIGVYETRNQFGHVDIVKMRDLAGNMFTWFASGYTGLVRDDRISIKGTVKKHDVFRGIKQTLITRCKFEKFEVMTPDEAAQAEAIA